jgi:hypothetical protein
MVKDIENASCGDYNSTLNGKCNYLNDIIDIFNMNIDKYKRELIKNNSLSDETDHDTDAKLRMDETLQLVSRFKETLTESIKTKQIYLDRKNKKLHKLKNDFKTFNDNADQLKKTNSVSEPRKNTILEVMQNDIIMQMVYLTTISICGYYIYRVVKT